MANPANSGGAKSKELLTRLERLETLMQGRSDDGADALSELERRIAAIEKRLLSEPTEAGNAVGQRGADSPLCYCALPPTKPRIFSADVSPIRAQLIRTISKRWLNGTKLRYYFFESGREAGDNEQRDIVRQGFEIWKNVGIGIQFEEVRSIGSAEIRIGFLPGDGAWSYVGRDCIDLAGRNERTMNFGWDLRTDSRRTDVAVHEIGHALGFEHEHQNPFAGIVWDEAAVLRYFGGPPNNWDREKTEFNILRKLDTSEVGGTSWDPDSIMHYAFAPGLIQKPDEYRNGLRPAGGLSARDRSQAKIFYPPIGGVSSYRELKPMRSEPLTLAPADQANFSVQPTVTRDYTIQTFGGSDTVMALFEDANGQMQFVAGDDDSGGDRNAKIKARLVEGRRYVVRLRMYYAFDSGEISVMLS
jgi:hypothetical protein